VPHLPIYLDYNATTPVAPAVAEAIRPFLFEAFGNPSSSHAYGRRAHAALEGARAHVARLIRAAPAEIVFTGCATESSNLAILGAAAAQPATRRHVVTSAVEHPATLEPVRHLAATGWDATIVPVDACGRVAVDAVAAALRPDTALVSIMHANNEVGTLQPIAAIGALTRPRGILLHTDAAQTIGKIPVDVEALGADLLTIAGHKFYATKGVGALYVRSGVRLVAPLFGAGQEHGLRAGTENMPLIVGLGEAARLALAHLAGMPERLAALRDRLHDRLARDVPGLLLNGHPDERLPGTLHVSFPGVSGRELLRRVDDVLAASVGSACHAESDAVSGVLAAMGFDAARAMGAVRLSVGTPTTADEVDTAADALARAWRRMR
jgi:cysteine desulfurase